MRLPNLFLIAALAAAGAHAQGLELFEADRYGGERLALDAPSPDLAAQGFRNRSGSLAVGSGRWEVCTEPQYAGTCVVFSPGRYDVLPGAIAQRIASARPVTVTAAAAAAVDPGMATGAAPLTLFDDAGWSGRSLAVGAAIAHLSGQGFNDITSSVEVRSGRWQLCVNADYGPPCVVLGPGRYPLNGGLHDAVSSVRPVYGSNDQPLPAAGGVVLYEDAGFAGRSLLRSEATPSLRPFGFNDTVSSIEVLAGRWELCADDNYGGSCKLFGPGRYGLERPLHDGVSSLRPR